MISLYAENTLGLYLCSFMVPHSCLHFHSICIPQQWGGSGLFILALDNRTSRAHIDADPLLGTTTQSNSISWLFAGGPPYSHPDFAWVWDRHQLCYCNSSGTTVYRCWIDLIDHFLVRWRASKDAAYCIELKSFESTIYLTVQRTSTFLERTFHETSGADYLHSCYTTAIIVPSGRI